MNELEQMHKKLIRLVFNNPDSIRKPKRHGDWLKLELWDGDFFEVDTWNKNIQIKRGSGEYHSVSGYKGHTVLSLGGSFGGFFSKATNEQMEWAINMAKARMTDPPSGSITRCRLALNNEV